MLASALLAAASAALGADYYVSPGNTGAQAPYATWETAAATIEDAMALAVLDKGCTVTLDDGEYGLAEMLCVTNTMTLTSRNGRAHTFVEPGPNFPANTRLCLVRAPTKAVADRPVVSGITFRNATITSGCGAGIHVSYPGGIVQDCRVTGCKMLTSASATPTGALSGSYATFIYRCIIDNNEARWENPEAQDNKGAGVAGITFIEGDNNAAGGQGGPVVENCLIVHNYGPAISYNNITYAGPVFRNCTAVDNGGGAGLYHARESTFVNCIFLTATTLPQKRGNGISVQANFNRGATTWSHCYYNSLGGSYASGRVTWTDNVIGFDPKFVNPRAMDYRLRADSPCRGAGAAWNGTGTTDLDGNTIPASAPDIGCYQYDPNYVPQESVLYVATTGDDANDGSDEAHAFATIPAAYAAAADGDEIRVGPGTYTLDATLTLDKKVALVGAGIDRSFITTSGAFRPVSLENAFALVSGFTFADIPYDGPQLWNGGVLENCRVTRCTRTDAGSSQGFVRVRYGCVNRCIIDANTNTHNNISYAVFLTSINPVTSITQPAGFLVNSLVTGNYSKNASSAAVYLHRNQTSAGGVMRDCTVACNAMAYAVSRTSYGLQIANCILRDRDNGETKCWSDGAATPPADRWPNNCTPVEVGTGCVTANPLFKNAAKGNFHLSRTSPCIGAAAPVGWLRDNLDLDGRPRLSRDGTQDIGCYQVPPPSDTVISVR